MLEGIWNINKHRADATQSYTTPHRSMSSSKSPFGDGIGPQWPCLLPERNPGNLSEILEQTWSLRVDAVPAWRLRARHRPVTAVGCGIRLCGIPTMLIYVPGTFRHLPLPTGVARTRQGGALAAAGGWIKIYRGSVFLKKGAPIW